MPGDVKVLIDEDTHLALAAALRQRGHDAIHVREAGRLGLNDEDQLGFAAEEGRCFLTCNVGEFVEWHRTYMNAEREHSGIIVSAQKPIGRLLRERLAFLQTHSAEGARNQLFFL